MRLRAVTSLFLSAIALPVVGFAPAAAQERPALERIVRDLETQGFTNVSGLARRGGNYVFQATDPFGDMVRVVMNIETGEIVGLSRTRPKQK